MDKTPKTICNFDFALTDKEWEDIRALARQIFASGQFGKDHCKCYIAAFVTFSEAVDEQACAAASGEHTIH